MFHCKQREKSQVMQVKPHIFQDKHVKNIIFDA